MYAKLVMSTAPSTFHDFCRDIARLLTSASPSTSLLSSNVWNVNACTIVDSTPAGWTYVGTSYPAETELAGVNSGGGNTSYGVATTWNWVLKSACASPNQSKYKYLVLNESYSQNANLTTSTHWFTLGSAQSSTSSGVLTNETYRRYFWPALSNPINLGSLGFNTAGTYHLIANARHVTLIKEGEGIMALWEHSPTDLHTRYSITPSILYQWKTSTVGAPTWAAGTGAYNANEAGTDGAWLTNITDVNSGTTYGSVNIAAATSTFASNGVAQPYLWPNTNKVSTISSTGATRQLVSPVMFQYFAYGYPTMYVSGVVPIYFCKGGIGSAGDSVSVNGVDYIYIPVNAALGVAIQSS